MLRSKTLQTHLLGIYHAAQRPSDEEIERRQQHASRGGRGRGRGRGRGGGGGDAGRVTWTQERGDNAALARLKKLRVGGFAENKEVEEFVKTVAGALGRDDKEE